MLSGHGAETGSVVIYQPVAQGGALVSAGIICLALAPHGFDREIDGVAGDKVRAKPDRQRCDAALPLRHRALAHPRIDDGRPGRAPCGGGCVAGELDQPLSLNIHPVEPGSTYRVLGSTGRMMVDIYMPLGEKKPTLTLRLRRYHFLRGLPVGSNGRSAARQPSCSQSGSFSCGQFPVRPSAGPTLGNWSSILGRPSSHS